MSFFFRDGAHLDQIIYVSVVVCNLLYHVIVHEVHSAVPYIGDIQFIVSDIGESKSGRHARILRLCLGKLDYELIDIVDGCSEVSEYLVTGSKPFRRIMTNELLKSVKCGLAGYLSGSVSADAVSQHEKADITAGSDRVFVGWSSSSSVCYKTDIHINAFRALNSQFSR